MFKDEASICKLDDFSSITVRISVQATRIPGILYSILKMLAWEGISLIECVSTYTELTIVFETKDIEKAFSIIKNQTESSKNE